MHSKNVIHRYLKLKNILLTLCLDIKIADLGLSKVLDTFSYNARPTYGIDITMAPQIFEGNRYTFATDIW
jgi:serine/threonine protein kinase